MEKNGDGEKSVIPLLKCFELSKRPDMDNFQAQKMVVLARLMNKLESIATKTKTSTTTYANRYINKAKTALYTTLCF